MRAASVSFVLAALTAALLTPLVREWARRSGAMDHALSARKVHGRAVPRLGGIAIALAFYSPLLALFFVSSEVGRLLWEARTLTVTLLLGSLAIVGLGVYDDLNGSRASTKFTVQFLIAALTYWAGYRIDSIVNPFGPDLQLGWFGLPFTMLWIAGVTNAMNLIDGLDGLAGGVALIAVGTIFVISGINHDAMMQLCTAALGGAVLGFLIYNFNPATIFMGDSGSMLLGYVLAATAIRTNQKSSTTVALVVPILALGIPIADTLLAIGRRALRGAPLFAADRGHIHHRLMDLGLSHRQAVLIIYVGGVVLGGGAVILRFSNSMQSALVLLGEGVLVLLALRLLGFVDLSKAQVTLVERRKNLEMRAAVRNIGERLRAACTPEELWHALRDVSAQLGATAVALHLGRLSGRPDSGPWSVGFPEHEGIEIHPPGMLRARYGLLVERPGDDYIDFGWTDGREGVDRGTEIAIELLCDHLVVALDRIERDGGSRDRGKVIALRR